MSSSLPSDIQDGEYIVKMFFKYNGDFVEPRVEVGKMNNYLHLVVADGKVTIDKEPVTSGISQVTVDDMLKSSTSYFNLSGQRLSSPSSGNIVILKQGNNVRKVMAQ